MDQSLSLKPDPSTTETLPRIIPQVTNNRLAPLALVAILGFLPFGCAFRKNRPPLETEDLRRAMNGMSPKVRDCYHKLPEDEPKPRGRIVLQWQLSKNGKAEKITVPENTTQSKPLEDCMREKLAQQYFPKPRSTSQPRMKWPWIFHPNEMTP